MAHSYRMSGLAVASEAALPGVDTGAPDAPADVMIRQGLVPDQLENAVAGGPTWQLSGAGLLLSVPGLIRFLLSEGTDVVFHPESDQGLEDAAAFLLGPVWGLLMHQHRQIVLGEPLLAGARGAAGAILIVRDPRDVAGSLATHMGFSVDAAIAMMNNPGGEFSGRRSGQQQQLRQRLLAWSGHAESWLSQTDIPVHLVRYEDLHADAGGVFTRALAFAGHPATPAQIGQAAARSGFAGLQAQEVERGFREAQQSIGAPFFRRGEAGAWWRELSASQVERIESAHAGMMRRLGYTLSAG